jgi:hypothetical protein
MARRSQLVELEVANIEEHDDGSATVTFERLKTHEPSTKYLSPGDCCSERLAPDGTY